MADFCTYGEGVICYAEGTLSFLVENLGFFSSSIDCLFAPFLSLTSSITFQLFQFIEDLVLSDVDASSEDSVFNTLFNTSSWFSRSSSRDAEKYVNYSILERKVLAFHEESNVYKLSETTNCHNQCATFIFHGLAHPLSGLTLAGRIAFTSCRYLFSYIRCVKAKAYRIISRVKKTLQGSSGDIGWLQHTPGFAPVKDGTVRFRELLSVIRNGEHTLPNSYIYLLIPGLFSNHGPLYFVSTKRFFSRMGLACHIAKIHSEASVEHNAWELKHYIEELYWGSGKQVMLLGHSKGGVDAAAALSIYWDALKGKVAGLALVQSPYGGTPLASDILREGQIADKETRRIMELIICRLIKGDIRALEDLTYEKRKEFISKHKLPEQIPLISFHSEASIAPSVLATLTQIAHAELPWFPLPGFSYNDASMQAGRKVPVVVPVSAAMALCALHLQLRYGEKSDGLVTRRDAEVPGSVVIRPDRKLDHAWMVYSSWRKSPSEPDASEMYCEALLTMLVELSTMKKS